MEFVIVAIVLAVALVGVVGFLVTAGRRRPEPPAPPASRSSSTSTDAAAPASTATLDRPETLSPDDVAELEDILALPPVERPEPTRGRLQRLRARLARSQSALGRTLLVLLSRDTLDDDAWEEIEDTLLAADVGVQPSAELVDRLRTRVRVAGSRTPAEAKAMLREELIALVGPVRPHLDGHEAAQPSRSSSASMEPVRRRPPAS